MKLFGLNITRTNKAVPLTATSDTYTEFFQLFGGRVNYSSYNSSTSLIKAFKECPQLHTIIGRKAKCFTDGKIEVLNASSNNYVQGRYRDYEKLIANPNPLQTDIQFRIQLYTQIHVFGYAFVLKANRSYGFDGIDTLSLWVLPSELLEFEFVDNITFTDKSRIKSIYLTYGGKKTPLNINDLILFTHLDAYNDSAYPLPLSPFIGLEYPIQNIIKSYESAGTLIQYRGALGILSNDSKDGVSHVPMLPDEKSEIQKQYRRYGLTKDQWQLIITTASLRWQPMSMPVKDLMLNEEIKYRSMEIADKFGYPSYLLSTSDNGTFNNVSEARKSLYESTIIPEANLYIQQLAAGIIRKEDNVKFQIDFSHVPALQQDEEKNARATYALSKALEVQWKNNIITRNQYLESLGIDTIGKDGDLYYYEFNQKYHSNEQNQTQNAEDDQSGDQGANQGKEKEIKPNDIKVATT